MAAVFAARGSRALGVRLEATAALGALLVFGCRAEPPGQITVVVGPKPEERATFAPGAAFAEYVELPSVRNELRITLAGYDASCERYVPPEDDEAVVIVTLLMPPDEKPERTTYSFDRAATVDARIEAPLVLPKTQIGRKSYLFEPGGTLRLTDVQLASHGTVSGLLDFHFRGEAGRPATRVEGSFSATLCRLSPAPER